MASWFLLPMLFAVIVLCIYREEALDSFLRYVADSRGVWAMRCAVYCVKNLSYISQDGFSPSSTGAVSALVLLAIFFHPRAKYSVWTVLLGIWPFFPWTLASIVTWINMMHPVARLYLQKTGIDELGSRTSMLFFGVLYLVILWKSTKSRWIALSYVIVLVSSDLMWIVQYDLQWRTSPIIRSVCV